MDEVKETNSELNAQVIEEKEKIIAEVQENPNQEDDANKEQEEQTVQENVNNEEQPEIIEDDKEKKPKKEKNKKKLLLWLIPLTVFLALAIIFSTIFALININNNKIISGVTIDKVIMKGLNREEAIELINKKIEEKIKEEIIIKTGEEETTITLEQLELEYLVQDAVEKAYSTGRNSNIFVNNYSILKSKIVGEDINLQYKYNEELLQSIAADIKAKIPNGVKQTTYSVEDNELIITKGVKGFSIDEADLKNQIENNINLSNHAEINLATFEVEPNEIDIEKIYNEVHTEAQDAYYTKNPFQIYPEVVGIDFDLDEAKELLKEDKEEYTIPLIITKPKKTVNEIGTEAFPYLLSTFSTRYDESNVPRSTNLKIAVSKLNGKVIMPGETFSYNSTLGKRTEEAGYRGAAGYEGGKVVDMIGGGICQISSTLYDAVVYANLEIVERHNHAFTTSYVGAGKDATVVYGALDFKFKNTRKFPVSLKASATNGIARVEIYGIKEETEYEIEIVTSITESIPFRVIYEDSYSIPAGTEKVTQYGMNGCRSITYKIFKLNGSEVSREVLSRDKYDAMNKYITRGISAAVTEEPAPVEPKPSTPVETQPAAKPETSETEKPNTPTTTEKPTTPETTQTPTTPQNTTPPANQNSL